MGTSAVVPIIEEREKKGPFTSIFDFMERIDLRACNRRVIENMTSVGAFDSFGTMHRAQFFALDKEGKPFIEKLMLYGSRSQTEASQIQYSIFDEMPQTSASIALPPIPTCDPWTTMEQLKREKEIAGFFISGHPLDDFKPIIKCFSTKNLDLSILSDTSNWPQLLNRELCFVASVSNTQTGYTKNGKEYGKLFLEDYEGSIELPFWGQTYNKFNFYLFVRLSVNVPINVQTVVEI